MKKRLLKEMFDRTFKVDLAVVFTSLIVIAISTITYYTYHKNSIATLKLSSELIEKSSNAIIIKTSNHLKPALIAAKTLSELSCGTINIKKDAMIENYMISTLKLYPQFQMFYIGDKAGNLLMVARQNDGTISTEIIDKTGKQNTIKKSRNSNGKIIEKSVLPKIEFDARVRPWYIGAKRTLKEFWTDIYLFFDDKKPGITASFPVINKKGEFTGVVGIDIALKELSNFLRTLKVGKNGKMFIINEKKELIAHPDGIGNIKTDNNTARFARISEIDDSVIRKGVLLFSKSSKKKFSFKESGQTYLINFKYFDTPYGSDWYIVTLVLENDFVGDLRKTHKMALLISLIILIIAIIFSILLSRTLSKPIELITEETRRIKNFDLESKVNIKSSIKEIQMMTDSIASMKVGLLAFKKYIPATLVRELIKTGEEARLGGTEKELTLLFSDIKDFTQISEKKKPKELMVHLSEYFESLSSIISGEAGTVDKYIGDSIMAFWGAPIDNRNHAISACRAALKCSTTLNKLNKKWKSENKMAFPTRFGIHTGNTVVGNMGSNERMNYTVLGDSVNLASRLEGINKIYGTTIIISEDTKKKLNDEFVVRILDIVAVKGKDESVRIYELMALKGDLEEGEKQSLSENFQNAFDCYIKKEWQKALVLFNNIHKEFPLDKPANILIERCKRFINEDPGENWDGIFRLNVK